MIEDLLTLPRQTLTAYLSHSTPLSVLGDFFAVLLITVVFATIYSFIYNLYFHPLASFPGPFFSRCSRIYMIWTLFEGQEHINDDLLHQKYGPIVRKAPNTLSFKDPSLLPVFYHRWVDKAKSYEYLKMWGLLGIFRHIEHSVSRKKVAAPFTVTAVAKMEPKVTERVNEWVEKMGTNFADTGKPFLFCDWAGYLSYDIISEVCFGKHFGFVADGNDRWGLSEGFRFQIFYQGLYIRLPGIVSMCRGTIFEKFLDPQPEDGKGLGQVMDVRDHQVQKRLDNPNTNEPDILSHLMKAYSAGEITMEQLKKDMMLFMVAGSDTAAITLREVIIYVLGTPGKYAALCASDLTKENLTSPEPKFPYLDAILKETLRYLPAAPDGFARVVSKGGVQLSDRHNHAFIPEGTEIFSNSYVNNRVPEVFGDDCYEFVPERWLVSEERNTKMEKNMNTFGYGSRVCLGKAIAELEMKIAVRGFFTALEPELVNKERPVESTKNYGLVHHKGLWITVKRRTFD